MEYTKIRNLLNSFKEGNIEIEEVLNSIKINGYEELGYAKVDHNRKERQGFPEVIYSEGKTSEQIKEIFLKLYNENGVVLATRAKKEDYEKVKEVVESAKYHEVAKLITATNSNKPTKIGNITVLTAGTIDIPVAEEAAITAEIMGNNVNRIYDVGVAGIHRLLVKIDEIRSSNVIITVAGMEGALPSVVGGLVDKPVIAVPTSCGYGSNFGGLSALLTMLNTCASGVSVVNIDNGFGAGFLASMINKQTCK